MAPGRGPSRGASLLRYVPAPKLDGRKEYESYFLRGLDFVRFKAQISYKGTVKWLAQRTRYTIG
ncbi:hypothetical protein GCM10010987_44140 [Bradyrhizobium guangdongense]|uniref:Uncharacterized protein n=1 Tax=Bradyrhizobium guangdongense TaxID=1325090 RepID=A0AA87W616_9BRAD|nr:hypothetical protein GCM10010987_44140 [Bradyrhizobium guangdongense]